MNSFIVQFWARVFGWLAQISLFALVRAIFPQAANSYSFVDSWVLAHLVMAFGAVFVVSLQGYLWLEFAIVVYGSIRVLEITVYQANVLLFDEYRAKKAGLAYALKGYRRLVILLMHNYFEIVFWFASSYIFFAESFTHKWSGSYKTATGAIYTSFIAMSTFGDFNVNPADFFGAMILLAQAVCGLFMTLLTLARFIALLPPPATLDALEMERSGHPRE